MTANVECCAAIDMSFIVSWIVTATDTLLELKKRVCVEENHPVEAAPEVVLMWHGPEKKPINGTDRSTLAENDIDDGALLTSVYSALSCSFFSPMFFTHLSTALA